MSYGYGFAHDQREAEVQELRWAMLQGNHEGVSNTWINHDRRFDVCVEYEDGCRHLWEVKHDTVHSRTRNIGVEYECKGRPSGIETTEAHSWVFRLDDSEWWMIGVIRLKRLIAEEKYFRKAPGGEKENPTMMYLFKEGVLKPYMRLFDESKELPLFHD